MSSYVDDLRRTLEKLLDERQHIDADIRDLQRILSRHEGGQATRRADTAGRSEVTPRGGARDEILKLLEDGPLTANEVAQRRGTTRNAAYAALKRMLREHPPAIELADDSGAFRLPPAVVEPGRQASLAPWSEREPDIEDAEA